MEHKFKVGDRVRRTRGVFIGGGLKFGDIGTVSKVADYRGEDWIALKEFPEHDSYVIDGCPFAAEYFEPVNGSSRPVADLPPKFILQYDLDTDPFELFSTEKELRARIAELALRPDLKRDSIRFHVIARTRTVTLGVKITIKYNL